MDDLWQDVIPENSGLDLAITLHDGRQLEVLAVWIGPGGLKGISARVPVVKIAGLPDWCKIPHWPEDGTLPYKRIRGMLQLMENAARQVELSRWDALEVQKRRRARQKSLLFIPRCYNSEPSNGPCYTLYDVPGLDVESIKQLIDDMGNGQLEVL